jgi:hypothetical protein
MQVSSSWRRVAVVLGALAVPAAMFAPPAIAKSPDVLTTINCSSFSPAGTGTVNIYSNGSAKGHCSFPNGFPDLGLPVPGPGVHGAVHDTCDELAKALGIPLVPGTTPTGDVVLTPSGNANVNCRNVRLALA